MSDSSEEAQQKLAALEAKYADDLTRSEAQFVEVAESMSGKVWFTPPPRHDAATRKGSAHQGETHSRTFASGGVGKRVNRDGPRGRCHRSDVKPRIGPESWVYRKSSLVCPGVFVCHQRQPRGGLPDRLGQRHLRSGRRDGRGSERHGDVERRSSRVPRRWAGYALAFAPTAAGRDPTDSSSPGRTLGGRAPIFPQRLRSGTRRPPVDHRPHGPRSRSSRNARERVGARPGHAQSGTDGRRSPVPQRH